MAPVSVVVTSAQDVAELLEGKGIDMPPIRQVSTTFRKAPRSRRGDAAQAELDL